MDGGIKLGCGSFEVYKVRSYPILEIISSNATGLTTVVPSFQAHIAASVAHQASRNERNVRVNVSPPESDAISMFAFPEISFR